MIKGKFVGKVNISLEIQNDYPGLRPYDEMKEEWEKVADLLKSLVENECGEEFSVSVEPLESELIKTDD